MSKVTIYTLAKELNMTPSMVSRAFSPSARISEDKRKLVLDAARKYDFSPNKLASRLSMKPIRIGVLINSRFSINSDKMISAIKEIHAELEDYKIQYDITLLNQSKSSFEDVRKTLEQYKTYDGIILTGMSSAIYTELINELYAANPNVVQVQAQNSEASCLFASKHNECTASALAAEFLANCFKRADRKNILLFTGDLTSALHSSAQKAFKNSCDALGLNLLSCVDMKDSDEYFKSVISEVFERYGDSTDGIYITSGMSSVLCKYLEDNRLDIPLVAFDTYEEIKEYMEKGIISATIAQNVSNQMKTAFELLVKHIMTGEKCPPVVYTDVQLVLKSNMHQFN